MNALNFLIIIIIFNFWSLILVKKTSFKDSYISQISEVLLYN